MGKKGAKESESEIRHNKKGSTYIAGFEGGGRDHEPRNAGSL